jgi:hypothetical protein
MEYIDLVVAILAGLATAIPLVIKLIEYVKIAYKNGEWDKIVKLATTYMKDAELLFDDGESRKEYVMLKLAETAEHLNYTIDMEKISDLIDDLCEMAKVVNKNHEEHTDVMNSGE